MIIGIIGKAFSGKSTVAKMVQSVGLENGILFTRIAFADEVKRIARDCLFWDGKKDERGRKLLQILGTECGRGYDPEVWVRHWKNYANRFISAGNIPLDRVNSTLKGNDELLKSSMIYAAKCKEGETMFKSGVVSDDARFPNEIAAIRNYQGKIIKVTASPEVLKSRVVGDQSLGIQGHESEKYADILHFDVEIQNNGDLQLLEENVRKFFITVKKSSTPE